MVLVGFSDYFFVHFGYFFIRQQSNLFQSRLDLFLDFQTFANLTAFETTNLEPEHETSGEQSVLLAGRDLQPANNNNPPMVSP